MEFETLKVERQGDVQIVTLNRPDKLNSLSHRMTIELTAAAEAIRADQGIRVAVLTGAGRAFCAGADLTDRERPRDPDLSAGANVFNDMTRYINPMVAAWSSLQVPLLVAVNGIAAGGGVGLALTGDIVIAAQSARFIQVFAPNLGLVPDMGCTWHLPRTVGTARAKGLALLGEPLTATQAAEWGLIWAAYPDEELAERAHGLASRLASGPTLAFRAVKQAFDAAPAGSLEAQLAREAALQRRLADSADFAEGIAAFIEKRSARFQGR
ncbi:MAG TPA: enoyl-CoA hydratase-related protein [Steroidobacteraceae bacterium]|nr:enoyl-CoA hydratase-related protein [Steroidobacteraceae bacterium]